MKKRCYNKNNDHYHRYGGRGIKVCDEWLNSFECFLSDMGNKPIGSSIDRIDNDGDYSPLNCRWGYPASQRKNATRTRYIEYIGKKQVISDWAKELNIPYYTLIRRLNDGISISEVVQEFSVL